MNLENFESKKLNKEQLYPIGGIAAMDMSTTCNSLSTKTTGNDSDSRTSDQDDDPCE